MRMLMRLTVLTIVVMFMIGALPPVAEVGADGSRETELSFEEASTGLPNRGEYPTIGVGDFNGDGYLDIASGMLAWMSTNDGMEAYINNNGAQSFSKTSTGLSGEGGYGLVAVGDINEDGYDDIVGPHETEWSGEAADGIDIWFSDGGASPSWTSAPSPVSTGAYEASMLADIDKDGHLDLIANGYSNGIRVWLGDGGTTWTAANTGLPTSGKYYGLDYGDMDGDGNLDLVIGTSGRGIRIYKGDGGTSWSEATGTGLPTSNDFWGVNATDLDNDGDLDIAAAQYFGGLKAYAGNGGAGGSLTFSSQGNGLTNQGAYCQVAVGDVDQDGNMDILAGDSYKSGNGNGIRLYLGDGGAGGSMDWTRFTDDVLPTTNSYGGAAMADLDNDGDLDLIVSDAGWDSGGTQNIGIRAFKTSVDEIIHRPVPNAGPDQTVLLGDTVTLDGTLSSHTGTGTIAAYLWNVTSQPSGSSISLSDDTASKPTFVPHVQGMYVLSLAVKDNLDRWGTWEDIVNITANPWPNTVPTAKAGADKTVTIFDTVQLDGSGSTDDAQVVAYNWNITGQPDDSSIALSDETIVNPTFVPEFIGTYSFTLTVKDDNNTWSKDDAIKVTVNPQGTGPPVASAGPDVTIELGQAVTLDASGSSDDQEIVEWDWTVDLEPAGSSLFVDDVEVQEVTPTHEGMYQFSLMVLDNDNLWSLEPSATRVVVLPKNLPPVANIDEPEDRDTYYTTDAIAFDASGSSDPEGLEITYLWVSDIDGNLSDEDAFAASLSEGDHEVTLYVTDDHDQTVSTTIDLKVLLDTTPSAVLTASKGLILRGEKVTFDASDSRDKEGTVAEFLYDFGDGQQAGWLSQPTTTHVYTKAGTFSATVKVKDNKGQEGEASSPVTVTVGVRPTAAVSADVTTVKVKKEVTLDATTSSDEDGTISEYFFDFGDGTDSGWVSDGKKVKVYGRDGVYTAKVVVRDDHGFESTNLATVKVTVFKPKEDTGGSAFGGLMLPLLAVVVVVIVVLVVLMMVMRKRKAEAAAAEAEQAAQQAPPLPPPPPLGYATDQGQYQGYEQQQQYNQGYGYDQSQYQYEGYDQNQYQGQDGYGGNEQYYDQGQYEGQGYDKSQWGDQYQQQ